MDVSLACFVLHLLVVSGGDVWFGHDPQKWKEIRRRYFAELDDNREARKPILEAVRRGEVMLLYGARDREHNHTVAWRDYLAPKLKRR